MPRAIFLDCFSTEGKIFTIIGLAVEAKLSFSQNSQYMMFSVTGHLKFSVKQFLFGPTLLTLLSMNIQSHVITGNKCLPINFILVLHSIYEEGIISLL